MYTLRPYLSGLFLFLLVGCCIGSRGGCFFQHQEPRCKFGATQDEVIRVEGEPWAIIRLEDLTEEGQKIFKRKFHGNAVVAFIYVNYITIWYAWDKDGKMTDWGYESDPIGDKLVEHLKKKK